MILQSFVQMSTNVVGNRLAYPEFTAHHNSTELSAMGNFTESEKSSLNVLAKEIGETNGNRQVILKFIP
jgi:hypothetical protein